MSSPADHLVPDHGRDPSVAARVEQLYESHVTLVRSICGSLLRNRVEAEDAVQQTFLSAQRALLNGSAPRDAAAWLATIARHESLARVRVRMREPLPVETEEHGAAPDAHAVAVSRHEAGELHDALAGLPAQQREAILLREVRGFSYQEVAASLSVTTSAVESLLFRARRSLQTRLQQGLAALSPAELVQPLRELAMRVGGSGLAAPVAAKVAAVGVGTAVVAGGALVAPDVIGLGHPRAPSRHASRAPAHQVFDSAQSVAPAPRAMAGIHARGDVGSRRLQQVSDRRSTSGTHERERESTSGATAVRDRSSGTDTREGGGSGATEQVTSESGDQSSGETTGWFTGSSGSGADDTATTSSDSTTTSSDSTTTSSDSTTSSSDSTTTSSDSTTTSSSTPGD
jgi:RNA polymerase sigma factor (sigma-70 family)